MHMGITPWMLTEMNYLLERFTNDKKIIFHQFHIVFIPNCVFFLKIHNYLLQWL